MRLFKRFITSINRLIRILVIMLLDFRQSFSLKYKNGHKGI